MKLHAFGTRIKGVLTPPHCASLVWGYWDIVLSAHCKRYKKNTHYFNTLLLLEYCAFSTLQKGLLQILYVFFLFVLSCG